MSYNQIKRRIRRAALPWLSYEHLEVRTLLAGMVSPSSPDPSFHLATENQIVSLNSNTVARFDIPTIQGASYAVSFSYQLDSMVDDHVPSRELDIAVSWNDQLALSLTARPQLSSATVIVQGRVESSRLTFETLGNRTASIDEALQANITKVKVSETRNSFQVSPLQDASTDGLQVGDISISADYSGQKPNRLPDAKPDSAEKPISLIAFHNENPDTVLEKIEVERDRFFQYSTRYEKKVDLSESLVLDSPTLMMGRFQKTGLIGDESEIVTISVKSTDLKVLTNALDVSAVATLVDESSLNVWQTAPGQVLMMDSNQTLSQSEFGLRDEARGELANFVSGRLPSIGADEDQPQLEMVNRIKFGSSNPELVSTQRLVPVVSKASPRMFLVSWRENQNEMDVDETESEIVQADTPEQKRESSPWKVALTSVASLFVGGVWRKRRLREQV